MARYLPFLRSIDKAQGKEEFPDLIRPSGFQDSESGMHGWQTQVRMSWLRTENY